MKTYFRSQKCDVCGQSYDPTFPHCPSCNADNASLRGNHAFDHHVHDRYPFQLIYILIQTIGLTVFGLILAVIVEAAFMIAHPGSTTQELTDFIQSVPVNFALNAAGYLAVTTAFALLFGIRKRFGELFASFKDYKPFLFGAIGGGVIIGLTYLYGLAVSGIFAAAGIEPPGPNQNELLVREMVRAFPALSILVFGFIGPITEEIGYRVGLFGFMSRLGKVLGYLVASLVFALAHFDVTALFSGDNARLIVEFANLPSYVGAGLILTFLYDRFGLAGSYTAHVVNNLTSVIITLVG